MAIWKREYQTKKSTSPQQTTNQWILIGGLLILAVSISLAAFFGFQNLQLRSEILELKKSRPVQPSPTPVVFCTQDAKQCPDGSYVGRDPKRNCEFVPCP